MYASLTDTQRDQVVDEFERQKSINFDSDSEGEPNQNRTNTLHVVAIVAHKILCPDRNAWNSWEGTDAFAAALTVLIMRKRLSVTITDSDMERFRETFKTIPSF